MVRKHFSHDIACISAVFRNFLVVLSYTHTTTTVVWIHEVPRCTHEAARDSDDPINFSKIGSYNFRIRRQIRKNVASTSLYSLYMKHVITCQFNCELLSAQIHFFIFIHLIYFVCCLHNSYEIFHFSHVTVCVNPELFAISL